MNRYLFQCAFCGALLFKGKNPTVSLMEIEIKCPNQKCRKIIKIPDKIIVNLEKKKQKKLSTVDKVL